MNYIIGVDAGGTKTEAAAYGLDDTELGKAFSGHGNLLLDFGQATAHIMDAIGKCKKDAEAHGGEACLGIYSGIAGIEVLDYPAKIEALLAEAFQCKICALHDSEFAHAAIFGGEDGIVALSGTGSVCFGLYRGKRAMTGGWGHVLGDEGSGYHIALEAMKRITLEEDLGIARSGLSQALFQALHLEKANDIKAFIHSTDKGAIAAYASIVAAQAEALEIHAINILKDAGKDLALTAERLYKKLGIREPIRVGTGGSILNHITIVRDEFRQCLERDMGIIDWVTQPVPPTKGACYLHRIKAAEGLYQTKGEGTCC